MTIITVTQMAGLLGGFGIVMFLLVWWHGRRKGDTIEDFTVAGRNVGLGFGSATLLATWIWALSLYAPAQSGYQSGIAGPFWYSLGGAVMVIIFSPFVKHIRDLVPRGHTIAEFVGARYNSTAHGIMIAFNLASSFLVLFFNLSVAGYLISTFSQISYEISIFIVAIIFLSYSLVSGLKASILTDYLQLVMISLIALVVTPYVFIKAGGAPAIVSALPDIGDKGNFLSQDAFLELGLPYFLAGIFGGLGYQSLWQRVWAIRRQAVSRCYIIGGAGWFPYSLTFGMFGVIALVTGISSEVGGSDITPLVAAHFLPGGLAMLFILMVLAAVASSGDSALSAFSTVVVTDIFKKYINKGATSEKQLIVARTSMIFIAVLAAFAATFKISLLQLVLFLGVTKGAIAFPLLASLYWNRINAIGFSLSVIIGLGAGLGAYFYFLNISPYFNLIGILTAFGVSTASCALHSLSNRKKFDFTSLADRVRELTE
jgi:Na+/proline symporter